LYQLRERPSNSCETVADSCAALINVSRWPIKQVLLRMLWMGSGGKFDGFAVRRMPIRFGPGFFACEQRGGIAQALGGDEAFESDEPVFVVMRAVVWFATAGSGLEFIGERGGPLFPGEMALLGKFDGQSESLGLPRFGKDWSALVAGELRQGGEVRGFANRFVNWVRLAQDSRPTYRDKPNRAQQLARPKARAS